jgi:hypothetical protein
VIQDVVALVQDYRFYYIQDRIPYNMRKQLNSNIYIIMRDIQNSTKHIIKISHCVCLPIYGL